MLSKVKIGFLAMNLVRTASKTFRWATECRDT